MCHETCVRFGERVLCEREVAGKRVLEVGSLDVNGSLRRLIQPWAPSEYIGVDLRPGRGVDEICRVEHLSDRYGAGSFDLVIATELLEHVRNWRSAISNIKKVCVEGGIILVTTRSPGFPYHGFPFDFWRFEDRDMREIFKDCGIEVLERDPYPVGPGVFLKARKPAVFKEEAPTDLAVYSLVRGKRVQRITVVDCLLFRLELAARRCVRVYWKEISTRLPGGLRRTLRMARRRLCPYLNRFFSERGDGG